MHRELSVLKQRQKIAQIFLTHQTQARKLVLTNMHASLSWYSIIPGMLDENLEFIHRNECLCREIIKY